MATPETQTRTPPPPTTMTAAMGTPAIATLASSVTTGDTLFLVFLDGTPTYYFLFISGQFPYIVFPPERRYGLVSRVCWYPWIPPECDDSVSVYHFPALRLRVATC